LFWGKLGRTIAGIYIIGKCIQRSYFSNQYEGIGRAVGMRKEAVANSKPTLEERRKHQDSRLDALSNLSDGTKDRKDDLNIVTLHQNRNSAKKDDQTSAAKSHKKHRNENTESSSSENDVTSTNEEISTEILPASNQTKITPKLRSKRNHPGFQEFHVWFDAISSIYRMYDIGNIDTSKDPAIPILPRSERGRVSLSISVENKSSMDIEVYWMDYKGKETLKGTMSAFGRNRHWLQTTWIGHPWAFREKGSGKLLLYYVPYRIIPIIEDTPQEDTIGSQSFSISNSKYYNPEQTCSIQDHLLPYPATLITNIQKAMEISIEQMKRDNVSPRMLLKYLYNILHSPNETKYRQIRTSNKVFWNNIWCNGGRGVLHALGFEENGAFIEMGPNDGPLPHQRLEDVSNAVFMLEKYLKDFEDITKPTVQQPEGADGSGRANWRSL